MSLPPETIQVKRKRGADSPLDFLRVEGNNNKRARSVSRDPGWVYQLKTPVTKSTPTDSASLPSIPTIQRTQEGDESRPIKSLKKSIKKGSPVAAAVVDDDPDQGVRRFHLSKEQSLEALAALSRKRRGGPAVFVERSFKKSKPSPEPKTPREREESRPVSPADGPALAGAGAAAAAQPPTAAQTYKRPGARARIAGKTSLPPSLLNRDQDVNMDELAREMEAFALSQIASNLSRIEADSAKAAARRANFESSPNKSRFRPKVPAQRWAERHPNQTKTDGVDAASDHIDSTDDDDDDYVLETYERVPASRLRDQAVPPHRVGLLVFDNEPERVEFFYGVEDESSDEFPEDEEDENAENHYTADYPNEELDWDDEFDRNPYRYADGGDGPGIDDDGGESSDEMSD
ncbi:hypothetical protein B0T18DRAFT_13377 [Schizothecium vesticola]|uniref:Transcription factor Iwr1 domain-containing protein n=1 Tax=Schizothecium vesticola TaxID=314040 RepID=A0AA40F8Z0_9PEZI|nr:hypothetical protein B0T18DRAFT_13377 [Schizothecium vesticola]